MTKEQIQVKQFMLKFGQLAPDKPTIPSVEIRRLRAGLILEEAIELISGLGFQIGPSVSGQSRFSITETWSPDLIQIADGLADLHYVAYCGTGAACGLDMEPIFKEVHRSNMSKFWSQEDLKFVKEGFTVIPAEPEAGSKIFIVKDSLGKVVKSPNYSPAELLPFTQ